MNSIGKRNPLDWGLFAIVSLIWASAYAFTRIAVEKDNPDVGLPVEYVLSGRLTTGAIGLIAVVLIMGVRFPPLSNRKAWLAIFGMAVAGSVAPFYLITTAQQTVNSSLAALYTAASPIFVASGAHLMFADERLTPRTIIGIIIGFLGVGVLLGPDALGGLGDATVIAQIMLVCATMCYAASTLIARWAPQMNPIAFAAGFISLAAVLSWPLLLRVDHASVNASWHHWAAIIALGLGPSAFAQVLYMILVRRAGATFLSLTGYSIPILSAIIGWIAFRETQEWNAVLAFALILGGVWLAQKRRINVAPQTND